MTSTFPFSSRVTSNAGHADSAPADATFPSRSREPALPARDRELPPDFAALWDEACASEPTPTTAAASSEPVPGTEAPETTPEDRVEPVPDGYDADEPTLAGSLEAPADAASAGRTRDAQESAPETGSVALSQPRNADVTTIIDRDTGRRAGGEFESHLALRMMRNASVTPTGAARAMPAFAPATTNANAATAPATAGAAPASPPNPPATSSGAPSQRVAPIAVTAPSATATSAINGAVAAPALTDGQAPASAASARAAAVRTAAENTSGPTTNAGVPSSEVGQKNSLRNGQQSLADASDAIGTDVALPGDSMKSGSHFAPRSSLLASDASRRAPEMRSGSEAEWSFSWKGWSNGGGDRSSTAAQYSRFTEVSAFPVAAPSSVATSATARAQVPVPTAPATPAYPTDEAALLAPVNAAIERLVSRGQDQLSVLVRFEQGGSLSLKLTLRDGGIAAHMQTDLPGLEAALRSSWTSFAQDWNQRGVKLAAPSFGTGPGTDFTADHDRQRSPQHEGQSHAGEAPSFFVPAPGHNAFRGVRSGHGESADATIAAESSRAGLVERGLSTWA